MKTGIAVLGAGRWGIHLIRNFLQHPRSQLLAVIDPLPERLASVKSQFHLNTNVLLDTDFLSLKTLPNLDAVAVVTPASTHYELIARSLQQGYHVLAEKPLTLSESEAIELCQMAEKQQLQLCVDHTYLFHPAVKRGKIAIQEGLLGKFRYGYAQRTHIEPVRQDVDALWDLAIHDITIFNTWLEEMPIQVQATGRIFMSCEADQNLESQNLLPQLLPLSPLKNRYDLVWITLTYPSGFQAFIHLCWLNPDKQRRLGVVGSYGTLIFDELSTPTPLTIQYNFNQLEQTIFPKQQVLDLQPIEPLWQVCDHFLNCIQTNTPSLISSGWVGVKLIRILTALSESLNHNGQPISIESDFSIKENIG